MSRLLTATALLAGWALAGSAPAAEHQAVAPFLADDVVAVAYVNLEKVDFPSMIDELVRLNIIPEQELETARKNAAGLQTPYAELLKRGARRLYALVRVDDLHQRGTTWMVEVGPGGDVTGVATLLAQWFGEFARPAGVRSAAEAFREFMLPKKFDATGQFVVAASTDEQLKRAKTPAGGEPRKEAVEAVEAIGPADAGLVVFGDADSRRVVREMFPKLPAPFAEIDGAMLADGLRWGGVKFKLPPYPTVEVAFESSTPEFAARLQTSIARGSALAEAFLMKEAVAGKSPELQARAVELLPLVKLLTPKVEGARVSLTFGDDEQEIAFVRNLLPALTQQMRTDAHRSVRMNAFKQMAIAMFNYESVNKTFPPHANYDAGGRPLLSWRVHVLPFLEQSAIYNQFHLDEPWDSEHNRKLIEQMPAVYADPDPSVRRAVGDGGRTTYVLPTGEGLVFGGREGTKLRDITDGTSATIMIVETTPERAVVWTKPDDWAVDMKDPLAGLRRSDRDFFAMSFCDGSARTFTNDLDVDKLRAMLTSAGGEVVSQ